MRATFLVTRVAGLSLVGLFIACADPATSPERDREGSTPPPVRTIGVGALSGSGFLFQEPFTGADLVTGTSAWIADVWDQWGCLTARSGTSLVWSKGVLEACGEDLDGAGTLRLTRAESYQASVLIYSTPLPTSNGLDIRFKLAMWGPVGRTVADGADGISFFLKDGANTHDFAGQRGGALGYAGTQGSFGFSPGVPGGLIGIGFDFWGNFSQPSNATAACANQGPGYQNQHLVIRGPDLTGGGTAGYCYLAGTPQDFLGADRAAATRSVRIVVDPSSEASPKVRVYVGTTLPEMPTLEIDRPDVFNTVSTFKFGFGASTGLFNNNNEVWDVTIAPVAAEPGLPVIATTGGGIYTVNAAEVNFGHTVQKTETRRLSTDQVTTVYTGELLWSVGTQWRFKGTIRSKTTAIGSTGAITAGEAPAFTGLVCPTTLGLHETARCGRFSGTGTLERYDRTRRRWVSEGSYPFTATIYDGGSARVCKRGRCAVEDLADWFGLALDGVVPSGVPLSDPVKVQKQLNGGIVLR